MKRIIKAILKLFIPLNLRKKIRALLNLPEQIDQMKVNLDIISNMSRHINELSEKANSLSHELWKTKTLLFLKEQSLSHESWKTTPLLFLKEQSPKLHHSFPSINNNRNLHYKTLKDFSIDIKKNIKKISVNTDLIVGIPRSGMLAAIFISENLNIPCITLDAFLEGKTTTISSTNRKIIDDSKHVQNVLIIDDSIASGRSMNFTRELVCQAELDKKFNVHYAAVYGFSGCKAIIDFTMSDCEFPRVFQWNYLNHFIAGLSCYDIDGLLCSDPNHEQNDDGPEYENFLRTARPLYIPKYEIMALVTSRLEKYRDLTVAWLAKNEVKYKKLYMLDVATAEERRRFGLHAKFKSEIYKSLDEAKYFFESERHQALEITRLTGKPCFCTTTDELFTPEFKDEVDHKDQSLAEAETARFDAERRLAEADDRILSIYRSRSWRITRPLRFARLCLRDPREAWSNLKRKVSGEKNTLCVKTNEYFESDNMDELSLPYIEMSITTMCTLRCRDCGLFNARYYSKCSTAENFDTALLLIDIDLFLKLVDRLKIFRLIGGEPFLHPDWHILLDKACNSEKIEQVELITNGTLLPSYDKLKYLKHQKVKVLISNYGILSSKLNDLLKMFGDEHIAFSDWSFDGKWWDPGSTAFRNRTIPQLKNIFNSCHIAQKCRHLLNGKLYICSRDAHGQNLGIFPEDKDSCINLRTPNINKMDLHMLLSHDFINSCNYCDGTKNRSLKPAIQFESDE